MIIETERLYLRKFTFDDIEKTLIYSQEPSRAKGIPNEVYANMQAAKENVEIIISKYQNLEYPNVLTVVLKNSNEYIGHVSLSKIPHGIEVGYAICEKHQNQGYATEAIKAYVNWAKDRLNLDKIYGLTLPDNIASARVLEKAGFHFIKDDNDGEYIKGHHYIVHAV